MLICFIKSNVMKKFLLLSSFFCVSAVFIVSCNSNNKPENSSDRVDSSMTNTADTTLSPTNAVTGKTMECYKSTKNRDTIALKLNIDGKALAGNLKYDIYEKDGSSGTVAGEMKGDTLIFDYTFDAEGMRSVREMVFVKKDNQLYEGFGDVEEKNGKMVFKNKSALKFGNSIVLTKTNCE